MSSSKAGKGESIVVSTIKSGNTTNATNGNNGDPVSAPSDATVSVAVAVAVAVSAQDRSSSNSGSSKTGDNDSGVIAAPAAKVTNSSHSLADSNGHGHPTEIPLHVEEKDGDNHPDNHKEEEFQDEIDDVDESEYEYEDEDDAAFSGFLVDHGHTHSHPSMAIGAAAPAALAAAVSGSAESPARIRDDVGALASMSSKASSSNDHTKSGTGAGSGTAAAAAKPKWREPSRQAINMSLRAEREKSGSKRRLAQDLYRIMNQDTEEAGFSIGPKSEDSMDHWIIKLLKFDPDSNLAKDMVVLGFEHIELEMSFPDQYPFEPPFVRVVRPRFKRQTGFVMNGALCMELLTNEGWNPVNDIESVIVSIRSLLVVGDGRLQTAYEMNDSKYQARLKANTRLEEDTNRKRQKMDYSLGASPPQPPASNKDDGGSYSVSEAHAAYSHLSDYHKKKGWDTAGWWARKG